MTCEQIGEVIFWILSAGLFLGLAALILGVRVRIPVQAIAAGTGVLAMIGISVWAIRALPPETIGGILTWGFLALLTLLFFWALTR